MIPNKSVFITKKSLPSVPVGTPIQIVLHEQENYYALWSIGSGKGKKKEYRRRMIGWIDGNISHEEFCEYFEKVEYPLVKGKEKIHYLVLSEGSTFPLQKFEGLAEAKKFAEQITVRHKKETFIVQVNKKYSFNADLRCVEETQFLTKV